MKFEDENEHLPVKKIEIPTPENAKTACEVEFKEAGGQQFIYYIFVDEESSEDDIKAEQSYWEDVLHLYDLPMSLRKGVWEILAYCEELLESH